MVKSPLSTKRGFYQQFGFLSKISPIPKNRFLPHFYDFRFLRDTTFENPCQALQTLNLS